MASELPQLFVWLPVQVRLETISWWAYDASGRNLNAYAWVTDAPVRKPYSEELAKGWCWMGTGGGFQDGFATREEACQAFEEAWTDLLAAGVAGALQRMPDE